MVWGMRATYILLILKENSEIVVVSEHRVVGQSTQEDFVHGHCFLESS